MPESLKADHGRTVVVTGASSGIGRAVALDLAQRGFHVLAGVRRAHDAKDLMSASAGDLEAITLDVTDPGQVAGALETLASQPGRRLAGVVNNAGIAVAGPLEFLDLSDLRNQFEVNVIGQLAVAQAFLPRLRSDRGRLVFVGSVSGLVASRLVGAYAASKFALEAVGDALRRELAPWGVRVSLVEPGRIATPIWRKSLGDALERLERMPPEAKEYYSELIDELIRGAEEAETAGSNAQLVALAVYRALTARRPRTRYFVGTDAHIINVLRRVLSDPLFDRLIAATGR